MTVSAAAGAVGFALVLGGRAAAGFLLGASLAILNYLWLHQAIDALFDAGRVRVPKWLIAKFLIRYPLAIAGVYLFYRLGWLPLFPLVAGLFVPVAGVMMEALIQVKEGLGRPPLAPKADAESSRAEL